MTRTSKFIVASPLILVLVFLAVFAVIHYFFPPPPSSLGTCKAVSVCYRLALRSVFGVGEPVSGHILFWLGWANVALLLIFPFFGGLFAAVNVPNPMARFFDMSFLLVAAAVAFYILSFALLFPMLTESEGWPFIFSLPLVCLLVLISGGAKAALGTKQ